MNFQSQNIIHTDERRIILQLPKFNKLPYKKIAVLDNSDTCASAKYRVKTIDRNPVDQSKYTKTVLPRGYRAFKNFYRRSWKADNSISVEEELTLKKNLLAEIDKNLQDIAKKG